VRLSRVAGYLEELENCSATSSGTSETGTRRAPSRARHQLVRGQRRDDEASSETTGTSSGTDSTSTVDSTETTESSTGEPMAECGNGVLEAFGPVPEECDDGNLDPDDGCSETCALDRRVFVTSVLYKGGAIREPEVADALCANLADDQGWPDAEVSGMAQRQHDRRARPVQAGRGRLVMANGLVLAASWSALLAGSWRTRSR
jgi:cysteine-rich repeat protein